MSGVLSNPPLAALTPSGALLLSACFGAISPVHEVRTSLSPPEAAFLSFGKVIQCRLAEASADAILAWVAQREPGPADLCLTP